MTSNARLFGGCHSVTIVIRADHTVYLSDFGRGVMYRIFAIIAACVIAAITGFSWYAGMFDRLTITTDSAGPHHIVYREYRGAYQGIRFVMNDVYKYVRDSLHCATDTGFAVFFDTPGKVAEDSLRSMSGIVVGKPYNVKPPYKTGTIAKADAVVGICYLRSFFSYVTGGYKFSAELLKFTEENKITLNGPRYDLYDMKHRSIIYIAPVNRGASPLPAFSGK